MIKPYQDLLCLVFSNLFSTEFEINHVSTDHLIIRCPHSLIVPALIKIKTQGETTLYLVYIFL